MIVIVAAGAGAQQATPRYADEVRRMVHPQEDDLRRSTLVGSDDELAIATADGELLPLTRGCLPPVKKGGLIKVDCTILDGPAYYFFSRLDNGWTMTLTGESVTFVLNGRAPLERSYEVLERSDRRYSLEISDARSAKTRIDVELAPCGLFVESEEICDVFCENFADEVGVPSEQEIRDVARRIAGGQSGETPERIVAALRASIERGPRPIFLKRAFFTTEDAR